MFAKSSKQKITELLSIAAYHSFFYFISVRVILCSVHCHFLCRKPLGVFCCWKAFCHGNDYVNVAVRCRVCDILFVGVLVSLS